MADENLDELAELAGECLSPSALGLDMDIDPEDPATFDDPNNKNLQEVSGVPGGGCLGSP